MKSPFSESPSQAAGGSIRTGLTANEINHRSVASIEYHGGTINLHRNHVCPIVKNT
jgi:hypothetical protein